LRTTLCHLFKLPTYPETKIISLVILCLLSASLDFQQIIFTDLIGGIDAYYYLLQTRTLTTSGSLYFSVATPLTLYWLAGVYLILGNITIAIKLSAVLLHVSLGLALFSITKILTKSFGLGLVSLFLCFASGLHRYMVVEYISLLGAISFLTWASYFWIRYTLSGFRRFSFAAAGAFSLLIALGSHKSALPLTISFLVLGLLMYLVLVAVQNRFRGTVSCALVLLVAVFILPAFVSAQPFISVPANWRFEISTLPQFPATLSTFPELLIIFFGSICIVVAIFGLKLRRPFKLQLVFFLTLAASSVLVSLNPFISSQFGFATVGGRLRVLAYIQAALIVPGVIWLLREKVPKIHWIVLAVVVPMMLWSFLNPLPLGAQPDYLARRERLISGLQSSMPPIDSDPIVVAAHGEQFVVTYISGLPAQQSYPKDRKYESVYWLLNLVPPTFLDPSMHIIAKDKIGSYTVLVKDGPAFRQRLQSPEVQALLRAGNRHLDIYMASQIR
jgi:hypothetical protein